jgi:hypothetical protein
MCFGQGNFWSEVNGAAARRAPARCAPSKDPSRTPADRYVELKAPLTAPSSTTPKSVKKPQNIGVIDFVVTVRSASEVARRAVHNTFLRRVRGRAACGRA